LNSGAAGGGGVGQAGESDHRVKREVNARKRGFEKVVEFLLGAESFGSSFVAHLDEIGDGEISERVGVLFPALEVVGKGALAIVRSSSEAFVEDDAIFESGVHPLAVKRDDGVRGVADERDLVSVEPGRAPDRNERTGRVLAKIFE